MTSIGPAEKAPPSSSWTTSVHLSTTTHITQNLHCLLIFLPAPLNCKLLWGEGISLIWLPILSTVFGTQKDLNKVGWTLLMNWMRFPHCLVGRQKCYELWGAIEDGVEEDYGLSHSQCRDANYMGLVHTGNRDAAAMMLWRAPFPAQEINEYDWQ